MTHFYVPDEGRTPQALHMAEQEWSHAQRHLDMIMGYVKSMEDDIYKMAENTDPSVLFDFMKGYIVQAESEIGTPAHITTIVMCAAAVTKLVRAPRTDDPLAQLDKEMETGNDDDH